MNKLIQSTACTTCIAAATVPTALLSESSSPSQNDISPANNVEIPKPKTFTEPSWEGGIPKLNVASDIKEKDKYTKSDCLKKYTEDIEWSSDASENWDFSKSNISFTNNSESCLVVEFYKQPYKGGKWWGEFRLVWSLKDEKQGVITVVNVKTSNGLLKGSAAAYILKKESNKWNVKYKKEVEKDIKSKNELEELIPQADSNNISTTDPTNSWGFNPEIDKICSENDCQTPEGNHSRLSETLNFNIKNNSATNVKGWCKDLGTWFKKNFAWENIENTMNNVKGSWKK